MTAIYTAQAFVKLKPERKIFLLSSTGMLRTCKVTRGLYMEGPGKFSHCTRKAAAKSQTL